MLRELLKRDVRLNKDILVIPMIWLIGISSMAAFMKDEIILTLLPFGFLFVVFLPLLLHLREDLQGTQGDLFSLPVSRHKIVQLRFAELLILGSIMLILTQGAVWIAGIWCGRSELIPFLMSPTYGLVIGWIITCCFCLPAPIFFRWGMKGIGMAWGIGCGLFLGWQLIKPVMSWDAPMKWRGLLLTTLTYLSEHPGIQAVVMLCSLLLSFHLSRRALESRDL